MPAVWRRLIYSKGRSSLTKFMSIYHSNLSRHSTCQQYYNLDKKVEEIVAQSCNTSILVLCGTGHLTSINVSINIDTYTVIFESK